MADRLYKRLFASENETEQVEVDKENADDKNARMTEVENQRRHVNEIVMHSVQLEDEETQNPLLQLEME